MGHSARRRGRATRRMPRFAGAARGQNGGEFCPLLSWLLRDSLAASLSEVRVRRAAACRMRDRRGRHTMSVLGDLGDPECQGRPLVFWRPCLARAFASGVQRATGPCASAAGAWRSGGGIGCQRTESVHLFTTVPYHRSRPIPTGNFLFFCGARKRRVVRGWPRWEPTPGDGGAWWPVNLVRLRHPSSRRRKPGPHATHGLCLERFVCGLAFAAEPLPSLRSLRASA